ncbi:uncharacterized protein CC84DRAFT_525855 [Paraphaeosphaeria sporulosa]|uniref:Uncharacterized protein n=1 Tax=Paraphaeosphaeria sporulosa TaxID=1460663 RepID=A0A177CMK0_9PLEO|nr:uncharacterized protein CC84DRAFT_525855 [Paraphaeosphaeria sporulosa]OAG07987.1 hypothetical protein CC84DRAFT_525855 [Paraphaeosphaeria sporulosa]
MQFNSSPACQPDCQVLQAATTWPAQFAESATHGGFLLALVVPEQDARSIVCRERDADGHAPETAATQCVSNTMTDRCSVSVADTGAGDALCCTTVCFWSSCVGKLEKCCATSSGALDRVVLFTTQPRRARRHRCSGRLSKGDDGTRFENAAGAESGSLQARPYTVDWPGGSIAPATVVVGRPRWNALRPSPQKLIPLVEPLGFSPTSFPFHPTIPVPARPRRPFAPTAAPDAVAFIPYALIL